MTRLLTIILILFVTDSFAQHSYFAPKGIIHFERVVYTKARMREMMSSLNKDNRGVMFRGNIDEMPESSTSNFTLQFDETQTLMEPSESTSDGSPKQTDIRIRTANTTARGNMGGGGQGRRQGQGSNNNRSRGGMQGTRITDKIYYQNLKTKESEIQLQLDEKIVIKDSLPDVTWRFTDEFRTIAGYECRRVNGATKDSLYVIAFYTEEIPASGGPVLVGGLPGMILGLVIPEMHINYWATSVTFTNDTISGSWKEKKVKEMTSAEFFKLLSGTVFGGRGNNQAQQKRQMLEQMIY
ncbi:GLPGLI family protein [Sphingobacterium sp. SRCM116780]|uniref:GLPGLI family protein n=1 Tax=Sphingobacterium sp. SRCM116780 TaxID=2907623 RepID=UPI001F43B8DF|nr:GLPGLI family protein [Sphingobacterium sp. SRCM116780]UIR56147.1 GLPGLI family protein [Sphingobacterium sp. SRCM116780]